MAPLAHHIQTDQRRAAMLRTAFCPVVRAALEDASTIEIMVNPDGAVWVEKAGTGLIDTGDVIAAGDRERVIRLIASCSGETASALSPIVSAELPEGDERFEGLLPPVSISPCFSIRKPATTPFSLGDYVDHGALAPPVARAIENAIVARENIVVAGGTSSGKTTFVNALLSAAALHQERILILEDTRELNCAAPNLVQLKSSRDRTSLQSLVRSTLRLRPDRIIVGEVRGGEALDLLKAWNTGHPGGVTTLHANSAHGALGRLEQLASEATTRLPHELIAEAVDVVIYMSRQDGARRVTEAIRVLGFDGETYETEPLVSRSISLIQQGAT